MRPHQRPPTLGIVAAVAYVIAAFVPYFVLEAPAGVLEFYYAAGLAGPQVLSLFAFVAIVIFAAGRQQRSEPELVAGLTLILGLVLAVVTLHWAVSVPTNVILEAGDVTWFEYHRWVTLLLAAVIPVASLWYARELDVL
ncbi:hypothetical protein ACLI4Y_03445 [Natrialbaceae archaeon A-CW3]